MRWVCVKPSDGRHLCVRRIPIVRGAIRMKRGRVALGAVLILCWYFIFFVGWGMWFGGNNDEELDLDTRLLTIEWNLDMTHREISKVRTATLPFC